MSDIVKAGSLSATKGIARVQPAHSFGQDITGKQMCQRTQSIPTGTWTLVSLDSVSGVPAQVMITNVEDSGGNFVELALDNAGTWKFAKLKAEDFALWPPSAAAIYAQANTAAVNIEVAATEQ